jgi:hypothetical protein
MKQMSFDFGNPVEYGDLQDNVRLYKLNLTLHGNVTQVYTLRDVTRFDTLVRIVLKNGVIHDVPIADLYTKETLATLVLLGASGGRREKS